MLTRTPPQWRYVYLAVCMSGGGSGVCRCLHGRMAVGGGWGRVVKMQGLLFRPVRQWSSALLLWWRQRLPHRLCEASQQTRARADSRRVTIRRIACGGMRQWYQQPQGRVADWDAVEDCRRAICCTEKSVPSDRREALSGDVSMIRERLYWRLHVLPSGDYRLRVYASGDCEVVSTSSTFAVQRRPIQA